MPSRYVIDDPLTVRLQTAHARDTEGPQPNDAVCAIWSVTDLTVQPKVGLRQGRRLPSQTNADPISRPGAGPHAWIDSQQTVSQRPASLDVHEIRYS
jgi:hypothetical protein